MYIYLFIFVAKKIRRYIYCRRYTYIYVKKTRRKKLRKAVKSISFVQLRQRRDGRRFSNETAAPSCGNEQFPAC